MQTVAEQETKAFSVRPMLAALLVTLGLLAGCAGEEAVPIDPANPPLVDGGDGSVPDVTHPVNPTEQMEQLARQQCLDDPNLAEGYVQAVDPATDEVITEFSVSCSEVRSDN